MIYAATSVLNLAMGEFMTLGAFICFTALSHIQVPFYLAFIITLAFALILGFAVERLHLRPMIGEPRSSIIGGDPRRRGHTARGYVLDLGRDVKHYKHGKRWLT